jgi:hypothetical protein
LEQDSHGELSTSNGDTTVKAVNILKDKNTDDKKAALNKESGFFLSAEIQQFI